QAREGGGALGGNAKSASISGGEAGPGFAGQGGPGLRAGPGGTGSGRVATISGADHDVNDKESWYLKEHQLPEIRRARRIESTTPYAVAPASQSQSQSRAARAKSESETLKKPMSQRVPAESAEAKADANDQNLKVLFVFTPETAPASSVPAANPPK